MRFLHVMIRVKDIEKSLRFYTELLDMNMTYTVELDDATLYYLSDEDGQTQIELTYNHEKPVEYSHGSGYGHFAFGTKSMSDFTKKLYGMGYNYSCEPFYMQQIDSQIAFIKDPDGYQVEIIEG
ncbi:MAG: VOC family protein [Heliobacteriaceae bacterium]|jgi:lactoylglutathione lyase|nr:VOC family protein [Heliobacteriaceae bacterium]